jgi:hypothetical protein
MTQKAQKPDRPPRSRLITGQQIESEYGVPNRTVYDMHVRGLLPAVRFAGIDRIWYERAEVERLIERSRAGGPT